MIREDKEILIKDICSRLPYGVFVEDSNGETAKLKINNNDLISMITDNVDERFCKPYLRTISSMTKEEQKEFVGFHCVSLCPIVVDEMLTLENETKMLDWLNEHHFDYRGIIEKGLALEAPEGMY